MKRKGNLEGLLKYLTVLRNIQAEASSRCLSSYKLSPNELNVLILLSNNPSMDTARELVMYLGVSKTLICRSLEKLEKQGYLSVHEDLKDRRIQRISLLPAAHPLIEEIEKVRLQVEKQLLKGIDNSDLEATHRVFERMEENIKRIEEEHV